MADEYNPREDERFPAVREYFKSYTRPATGLIRSEVARSDDLMGSRLGGLPYAVNGETWPICGKCGLPIPFTAQVDLSKTVLSPFHSELLVLFCCESCIFSPKDHFWCLRLYDSRSAEQGSYLTPPIGHLPLPDVSLDLIDIQTAPSFSPELSRKTDLRFFAKTKVPFGEMLEWEDEIDLWRMWNASMGDVLGDSWKFSRVGGFLTSIQGWTLGIDETLLLQLGSEQQMWGDSGNIYLTEKLDNIGSHALSYDCY